MNIGGIERQHWPNMFDIHPAGDAKESEADRRFFYYLAELLTADNRLADIPMEVTDAVAWTAVANSIVADYVKSTEREAI